MDVSDDDSSDWMFFVRQARNAGGSTSEYWLANDAGLGVIYTMATSAGDNLIWSPGA